MALFPPGIVGDGDRNAALLRDDMFGFLRHVAAEFGDVAAFDIGQSPCILVNGAPQVRELFLVHWDHLRKPEFLKDSNRAYWGDGLTTLEGVAWKERRRLLRPSFESRAVASRLSVVAECTADMLAAWAPDAEIDLLHELRFLTGRIAVRTVLDADVEGFGVPEHRSGMLPYREVYGEDYVGRPGGDATAPLVMTRPRASRVMDGTMQIVCARVERHESRNDVLSDLVNARLPDGQRLTRDEIAGEVIQMLYAGHHTIPSSLVHLAHDTIANDVWGRVAGEAAALCGTVPPNQAALAPSYCLAALRESMRVHPPAPILYREVDTPFELGAFSFARDTSVWVSPMLLHHDARYFSEPQVFRPERFLDRQLAEWQSIYLPFGAGPRACIGNHMALNQCALMFLLITNAVTLTPSSGSVNHFVVRAGRRSVP